MIGYHANSSWELQGHLQAVQLDHLVLTALTGSGVWKLVSGARITGATRRLKRR